MAKSKIIDATRFLAQAHEEREPRPLALSRSVGSASAFAARLTVVVRDRIALM
jgi:hypothetical protein